MEANKESYMEKCEKLQNLMDQYSTENVVVAFSGGIDSSLLLKLAVIYGEKHGTRVYAITANTELHPMNDLAIAQKVAAEAGAEHLVLQADELEHADIVNNPKDRCYRCKKYLFTGIMNWAKELPAGIVMDGTNCDDLLVYRPGLRAIKELGVKSPLMEAGFSKAEVRKLAREYKISVAERASAPCLATRFPYGDRLTLENMKRADKGETYLKSFGLYNVRIRVHGEVARIEVHEESMPVIMGHRSEIVVFLKNLGYGYVTLDLEGFRSGSFDK